MKKVLKYYVAVVMFLLPVFILPIVTGAYGFAKNWFLGVAGLVGVVVWLAGVVMGKMAFRKSRVMILAGLFLVWSLVSWLRLPMGVQMRSLMSPMGFGTMVTFFVWIFLWIQVADRKEWNRQLLFLSGGAVVVGLGALLVFLLPDGSLPLNIPKENPMLSIGTSWSLTGSLQSEVILFLFLAIEWGRRLVRKLKLAEKGSEGGGYMVEAAVTVFFVLLMLLGLYRIVKYGWLRLDVTSSWVIAVESLKRSPLWGVGVGNFLQAFNMYRPTSYNMTSTWASGFGVSGLAFLQVWTELGLGGLLLLVLVIKGWWRQREVLTGRKKIDWIRMGLMLGLWLLLPASLLTLWLFLWLITGRIYKARESKSKGSRWQLTKDGGSFDVTVGLRIGMAVVVLAMVGYGGYWWGRIITGEIYLRRSFVAMAQNDGGATYDLQIKAMGANPRVADYRRFYSQTNLSISSNYLTPPEGEEVSQEAQENASVLIEQSVREAKAAVALDELNASYWANLASIYMAVAGIVEGAGDWSLQAYQQAVALDPVNPLLRIDLGGLLYGAGRYEESDRVFEQAVVNKNDYANSWYNWAHAAKMSGRLADAVTRLSQALALVPVDSGDYEKADEELTVWKKELDEARAQLAAQQQQAQQQQQQPETLQKPEPLPTVVEGGVEVDTDELEPPEAVVSPVEEGGEEEIVGEDDQPVEELPELEEEPVVEEGEEP